MFKNTIPVWNCNILAEADCINCICLCIELINKQFGFIKPLVGMTHNGLLGTTTFIQWLQSCIYWARTCVSHNISPRTFFLSPEIPSTLPYFFLTNWEVPRHEKEARGVVKWHLGAHLGLLSTDGLQQLVCTHIEKNNDCTIFWYGKWDPMQCMFHTGYLVHFIPCTKHAI